MSATSDRLREGGPAFARYLWELTALLDPGNGWYAVFGQRNPDSMRACLDGTDVPPWDVVEALLQDFAVGRDPRRAERETARARGLHAAAAAAHDRRPGGREDLLSRLRANIGERTRSAEHAAELTAALSAARTRADADHFARRLAWALDDRTRATARCAELRARLSALTNAPDRTGSSAEAADAGPDTAYAARSGHAGQPGYPESAAHGGRTDRAGYPESAAHGGRTDGAGHVPDAAGAESAAYADRVGGAESATSAGRAAGVGSAGPADHVARAEGGRPAGSAAEAEPRRRGGRRGPGGARFGGLGTDASAAVPVPVAMAFGPAAVTTAGGARFSGAPEGAAAPEAAGSTVGGTPSGARFAGAPEAEAGPAPLPAPEDPRAVAETVGTLRGLRTEGRGGEAHALLCETALRPAGQLPLLAVELERAGLGADWGVLLWEVAALPPAGLVAAVGALARAGRDEDCGRLLRQGGARPAEEVAVLVLGLRRAGLAREARVVLGSVVQARAPQELVPIARSDPRYFVPRLLDAARAVSATRERDCLRALRAAGLAMP